MVSPIRLNIRRRRLNRPTIKADRGDFATATSGRTLVMVGVTAALAGRATVDPADVGTTVFVVTGPIIRVGTGKTNDRTPVPPKSPAEKLRRVRRRLLTGRPSSLNWPAWVNTLSG